MPGTVIRRIREERNYSQKWMASQMGISQNAYSKIENNVTQLTVHHIRQLSKILDVSIMDLLNDEFEIHKPVPVPRSVQKADLLTHIERLRQRVEVKSAKDEHYLVALSLIIAAENTIAEAH